MKSNTYICCISIGKSAMCKLKKAEDYYAGRLLLTGTGGNVNDSKQWNILRNWKWVHKPLSKSVQQHGNKKKFKQQVPVVQHFPS